MASEWVRLQKKRTCALIMNYFVVASLKNDKHVSHSYIQGLTHALLYYSCSVSV